MGRSSKLSEKQWDEVAQLSAAGWSAPRIAKRCAQQWGVSISGTQINDKLKGMRVERAAVSKTVVREHLEKSLPSDLAMLDKRIAVLTEIVVRLEAKALETPAAIPDLVRADEQLRKMLDLKLHYAGADEQDDTQFSGLAELVGLTFRGDYSWKIERVRSALEALDAAKIDKSVVRATLEAPLRKLLADLST